MPAAVAIPAIAGVASAGIGALAGASNKRPPSLSPAQQQAQNALLFSNLRTATGTPTIDPVQQALLYGQNAASLTGANNEVTHALVSRGLGHSGILGQGLISNAAQSSANQNNINLGLQQQAVQQKDFANQIIAQLLQTPNTPGQSTSGAAVAGAAGPLAYALQQAALNYGNAGGVPNTYNYGVGAATPTAINAGVFGSIPPIMQAAPLPTYGVNTN
jgi:hypothetical protein